MKLNQIIPIALLLTILISRIAGADPAICENRMDHKAPTANPFLFLDMVIAGTVYPRALCRLDISNHRMFWRSYYRYHGCSPESPIGRSIERMLAKVPLRMVEDFRRAQTETPEKVTALCEKARRCVLPPEFDSASPKFSVRECPNQLQ